MLIKPMARTQAALAFIAVLAPMTLLRFGIVGVAELLMAVLFLTQVVRGVKKALLRQFPLTIFWTFFIFVSLCGSVANMLFLKTTSGTVEGLVFDLSAYVFILMTCFTLERLSSHEGLDPQRLLRNVFFAVSIVLAVLFFVSFYTPTLFGIPLLYFGRFAPLADNLHQISMSLVPLPFFGLIVMRTERRAVLRLLAAVLVVLDVVMAYRTGSTKAEMAIPVGLAVMAWAYPLKLLGPRYALLVNSLFATAAVVLAFQLGLVERALEFFVANDNRGARAILYQQGVTVGLESFLVGRGPGQHVRYFADRYADAHQTVITVFLQGGILGVIALFVLAVRIIRRGAVDPALLGALSTVTVYALGGDILRRLPIWMVLFIIAHYPVPAAVPAARRSRAFAVPAGAQGRWGGAAAAGVHRAAAPGRAS